MSDKRDFMLVHGAWHGGWCYARAAELLRARGRRAFTPTLTGLGERAHLATFAVNCTTHIRDVMGVITCEDLNDVVLCGHSYGGLVVGGVADAMPERIASLVYLDAIIPQIGKSVLDFSTPAQLSAMLAAVGDNGGLLLPPTSAASMDVNPEDQAMADALMTPQPFATSCERLHLTGAYMKIPKKTYVFAARAGSNLQKWYDQAKTDPDWTTGEVAAGHDVMLDAPVELAEILINAA